MLLACSVCFLIAPWTASPGVAPSVVNWVLLYQSSIKEMGWPAGQSGGGISSIEVSPFPNDSSLCEVDRKLLKHQPKPSRALRLRTLNQANHSSIASEMAKPGQQAHRQECPASKSILVPARCPDMRSVITRGQGSEEHSPPLAGNTKMLLVFIPLSSFLFGAAVKP